MVREDLSQGLTQDPRSYWKQTASYIRGRTGQYRGESLAVCLMLMRVEMYGRRWGLRSRQGPGQVSLCGTLVGSILFLPAAPPLPVSETRSHEKISNSSARALFCVYKQSLRLLSEERTETSQHWRQRHQLRSWHLFISELRFWGFPSTDYKHLEDRNVQSSPLLSLLLPLIPSFFLWYTYRLKQCYIIMGSITCCDLEDPLRIFGCRIGPAFLPFA